MSNIDVVLVEPEIAGNVGAIARAMKNFDFYNLILVNPKCDIKSSEAICRAKNAQEVLDNAKVVSSINELNYDYKIATTGKLGNDYNIQRSPLTAEELPEKILNIDSSIALCFGRESHGLTNDEISSMDFVVNIPSSKEYGVLNLSHAVSIILYEIFKHKTDIKETFKPINEKDKKLLIDIVNQKLDNLKFETESKRKTQKTIWKKIIGKSMLTKREAYALMGFFKRSD